MTETQLDSVPDDGNPQGHVIGFIETEKQCDEVTAALIQSGIERGRIIILQGAPGTERFHELMDRSQWGEEGERVLKEGDQELSTGHFVLCVKVGDRDEARRIAAVGESRGAYAFSHFGILADERLTR